MIPKILVSAPTSNIKDYCFKQYANQLQSFTYPNYDTYIVDNSKDEKYINTIWKAGIDAEHVEPGGSPIEYVTLCQNIIRNKVLKEGYDWLFMLETDVFVPENFLEYLVLHSNEVHTFAYFILNGEETTLCLQGATTKIKYKRATRLTPEVSFSMFTGEVKPINEYKIGCDYELYATGLGACFIHRSVLEKIEFRVDKNYKTAFADSSFFLDTRRQGILTILDTTFIPEHRRGDSWSSDLKLLN